MGVSWMRRRMFCWLSGLIVLALVLPTAAQLDRTVVILSWDGGKPSVIRQLVNDGKLPTIQSLLADGSYSWVAQTTVPSSTLPSHTSMLTGMTIQRHGITWNDHFRKQEGFVKVATVFELAKKAGLKTAFVVSKEKLKHIAKPGTLDAEEYVRGNAFQVAERAVRILRETKPNLLFVHFSDPDSAGHGYGWGSEKKGIPPSPEFVEALVRCDAATGRIVTALKGLGRWERALVIVTADHGGHEKTHGSADPEDVLVPWIAAGGLAARNGELRLQRTIRTMDTAATALAALGVSVPSTWDGQPVWEALREGRRAMKGQRLTIISEWKGSHCGIAEPRRIVVTDEKTWERLWRAVHARRTPLPPVPEVDFSKQMVLAVFMGQKRTSGFAIQIAEVFACNREILVHVKEIAPPPNAIVLQVLTQPYHIVVVPKVDGTVRFVLQGLTQEK